MVDFARVIRDSHTYGISFKGFAEMYCNQTIANHSLIAETLEHLVVENQIIIKGAKGKPKRSEKIKPNDIILPYNQLLFEVFKKK
jgi:hypothetical protein